MQPEKPSIWSHDSNETASGKPGTLHPAVAQTMPIVPECPLQECAAGFYGPNIKNDCFAHPHRPLQRKSCDVTSMVSYIQATQECCADFAPSVYRSARAHFLQRVVYCNTFRHFVVVRCKSILKNHRFRADLTDCDHVMAGDYHGPVRPAFEKFGAAFAGEILVAD